MHEHASHDAAIKVTVSQLNGLVQVLGKYDKGKSVLLGRKRTLVMGSLLALLAAVVFSTSTSFFLLMCAGIVDPWGDHGLVCAGGGDRTMRHNVLRDLLLRFARPAGYTAEAEKPGCAYPRGHGGRTIRPDPRRPWRFLAAYSSS